MPQCPLCASSQTSQVWRAKGHYLYHCAVCDVMFLHPQPDQEQTRQQYLDGYHGWMVRWHQDPASLDAEHRRELAWLQDKAALCFRLIACQHPQPGSVLDLGCTAGFFLEQAQKVGWTVEGVEINPATARVAAERLGCVVHTQPLEELDLQGRQFEVVTAWDVLEHLPRPGELLEQAGRVLSPGGLLGLSTPNHAGLFPRLSLAAAPYTGLWPHPEPPAHLFQFSLKSLRYILEQHGFELVAIKHDAIAWWYTFGTPQELRKARPKYTLYALAFILPVLLGPWLKRGDMLYAVARKKPA